VRLSWRRGVGPLILAARHYHHLYDARDWRVLFMQLSSSALVSSAGPNT